MHARPASARFGGGVLIGALEQLINELTARLRIPLIPLLTVPTGDVLEPQGADQRAGADAVQRVIDRLTSRADVDPQRARATRPLLAATAIEVAAGGATHLVFDAVAPGADWARAGQTCAFVAVYVDGRYHSTAVVLGERSEGYEVNLAGLPAGRHDIELRAATDAAPVAARVSQLRTRVVEGEQALVDRLAPVIELRDVDRGAGNSVAANDAPLLLVPSITRNADATRTIEYRMLLSNEDGGTPAPELFAQYGRGVDVEPTYRVRVDAQGHVLEARYQSALHQWRDYDGVLEHGRPVLRVSTANSMVSARTGGSRPAERWSDAAIGLVAGDPSDYDVMRSHGWTWAVMSKELLREGKVAAAGAVRTKLQVADPRRYVFLGPISDAARAAIALRGGLEVVLADGRRVLARAVTGFASGVFRQTALELPADALADAVQGVALLGVQALVLTATFGARQLAHAA
ncbi:MAG: hypothetical protein JWM86_503 [Thermoleophilia bacterium]|nr:hypothetical protein [Thermoleophilia bacterium]